MVKSLWVLCLVMCASSCRLPDELLEDVNARILVVGVDDDEIVAIDVADASRRSLPPTDGVVDLFLRLPAGRHEGDITVVRIIGDDGDNDDPDGDNDDDEQPQRCGTFTITVTDDDLTAIAITVDDLPRCEDDDHDRDR